jgi:hypothetical protein
VRLAEPDGGMNLKRVEAGACACIDFGDLTRRRVGERIRAADKEA